jgi:hypothetical protein
MPNLLKYYLQISLKFGFIVAYISHFNLIFSVFCASSDKVIQSILVFSKSSIILANYTLQILVYSQKQSSYTPEVQKSNLKILKSPEKEEKAVVKHLLHLHFYTFSGLFYCVQS